MKVLFVLPFLALGLTACQQNQEAANANLRAVLQETCPAVEVAYEYYNALKSVVSVKTQGRVELAKAQVDRICFSPSTATVTSALASGAAAYLAINQAIKEARASNVASVGYPAGQLDALVHKLRKQHVRN